MANASADATSLPSPLTAARLGTAPAAEATPGYAVRRLRIALGTWIALEATAASDTAARGAIESAYAAIAELAWRLHPLRNGSDVARINAAPPGTRVPIHASSARVLRLAHQIYALTDGVFDPCLPILPGRLGTLARSGDSPAGPAWALCHSPLALDLGGIAKGYAIDRAIEALRTARCTGGLVNAGGDLRVYGQSASILVRGADRTCEPLTLNNAALAVTDLDVDPGQRPAEHQGYYCHSRAAGPAPRFAAVMAPSQTTESPSSSAR